MVFRYMLSSDEIAGASSSTTPDTKDYVYTIDNSTYDFSKDDNSSSNYSFSQFSSDSNKITDTSSNGKFMLLSNPNQIPTSTSSSATAKIDNNFFGGDPNSTLQMLKGINNYYTAINSDIKYDLWIADLSIIDLWNLHSTEFLSILGHINKIYVLSDGNAQTYSVSSDYIKRQQTFGLLSEEQMKNDLDDFKSKSTDSVTIQKFNASSIYDYFRYTDFFTIFHIKDYSESPTYTSKTQMYKVNEIDWDIEQFANKMITNDSDSTTKTNLINNYFSFFKFDNLTNMDLSYFITQGLENYDPKKKNIIWIGDALTPNPNNVSFEKKNEIQETFKALTVKYNPNEYNYFFKHHPRYSLDVQNQLTSLISNGLVNAIYFKSFTWEIFLQWDHYKQIQNKDYVPFFSSTSNNNVYSQTTFVGIQYTTTVVPSTLFFLENTYGMSLENAQKTVWYDNFPVPKYFDLLTPGNPNSINPIYQEQVNREAINKIYEPYLSMKIFPDYRNQLNTTKFIRQYIPGYLDLEEENLKIVAISISVFLIACVLIFIS
ncbi:MAG: hypothetical protein K2I67_00720, partial [Malacoplasma sp.]|nr:hypothetical protein [Malacoplasma sp.]